MLKADCIRNLAMNLLAPRVRLTAKAGNRPDECEDSYRVVYKYPLGQSPVSGARVALADGASEAAFARLWAQVLVREYVENPPTGLGAEGKTLEEWLANCQARWQHSVPWDRLPWHGEAKTRAGSLATLAGLCFYRPPGDGRGLLWTATLVGDSCLFLLRDNALVISRPLRTPEEFNNSPHLLCSNPAGNAMVWDRVLTLNDHCRSGDLFILASDALSAWFLERHRAGEEPWKVLLGLNGADWGEWLSEQRQCGAIGNDDTSLVMLRIR